MKDETSWAVGRWTKGEMCWRGIQIEVHKNWSCNCEEWLARLEGENLSLVRVRCGPYLSQENAEKALCLWLDAIVDVGRANS